MKRLSLLVSGVITVMLLLTVLLVPRVAHASVANPTTREELCESDNSGIFIVPKWYKYIPRYYDNTLSSCVVGASAPGEEPTLFPHIPAILLAIFEILLRIAGIAAVIFVTYGGFQYLITTGEPDKAKAARTTIINALVGMLIAMFATVIVNVIGSGLTK